LNSTRWHPAGRAPSAHDERVFAQDVPQNPEKPAFFYSPRASALQSPFRFDADLRCPPSFFDRWQTREHPKIVGQYCPFNTQLLTGKPFVPQGIADKTAGNDAYPRLSLGSAPLCILKTPAPVLAP